MAMMTSEALHADAVLDRARNAGGDVELGANRLAGLAHLAVRGHPAGLDQRACRADLGAEHLGEIPDQLKILGRFRPRPPETMMSA
jgi:hypothetical protein